MNESNIPSSASPDDDPVTAEAAAEAATETNPQVVLIGDFVDGVPPVKLPDGTKLLILPDMHVPMAAPAADPLAEVRAALENRTNVPAKVTALVPSADKRHKVGARCTVLGGNAFLPASRIVAPKQSLPGQTILVRVTEVTDAPGKTPVVVSQRAVFEDFVGSIPLGSLLAGTACGVSTAGVFSINWTPERR